METETPPVRRRPRPWLLIALGLTVVAMVANYMWPTESPPPPNPTASRRTAARPGELDGLSAEELDVRLEALQAKRPDPADVERNPFRFKPPPVPPPPPRTAAPPPQPIAPPQPVAPAIPPISLKFMGTVEGPGIKLAALTDCKGFTYSGREGEPIDGRFRLVRIQNESIVMEYLNGTGRTTIRKSGECTGVPGK